jgi:hypothetical protein
MAILTEQSCLAYESQILSYMLRNHPFLHGDCLTAIDSIRNGLGPKAVQKSVGHLFRQLSELGDQVSPEAKVEIPRFFKNYARGNAQILNAGSRTFSSEIKDKNIAILLNRLEGRDLTRLALGALVEGPSSPDAIEFFAQIAHDEELFGVARQAVYYNFENSITGDDSFVDFLSYIHSGEGGLRAQEALAGGLNAQTFENILNLVALKASRENDRSLYDLGVKAFNSYKMNVSNFQSVVYSNEPQKRMSAFRYCAHRMAPITGSVSKAAEFALKGATRFSVKSLTGVVSVVDNITKQFLDSAALGLSSQSVSSPTRERPKPRPSRPLNTQRTKNGSVQNQTRTSNLGAQTYSR